MKISARTNIYGVIGYPIEHSLSPLIHNAAINALGIDAVYVAFHVKPGTLREAIYGMKALGVKGFNVTMPFKTEIIPYLDRLDEEAIFVEAVNTVVEVDGVFVGYTTDGLGAFEVLKSMVKNLDGLDVVVIGAGGAARALIYHLSKLPCGITILNRSIEKAKIIVEKLQPYSNAKLTYGGLSKDYQEEAIPKAHVIVNATPVGMTTPGCPISPSLIGCKHIVFDMIYWPPETQLLIEAKLRGATTVNGLPMLVYQAAYSFKLWFGRFPPLDVMFKAAEEGLSKYGER
ncbi:MAG: shikimate dehydrogenase [Nitrososphaerota archaeon]|nr:shikimate dehydrogenase [Candidatus Bathyarchaeota archaeon]MDW8061100.1 shikimate dehydrogenase [Nitrososphaerota archaeon]